MPLPSAAIPRHWRRQFGRDALGRRADALGTTASHLGIGSSSTRGRAPTASGRRAAAGADLRAARRRPLPFIIMNRGTVVPVDEGRAVFAFQ